MTGLLLGAVLAQVAAPGIPEEYRRQWADPAMAERIDRGIEKHRKGDLTVELSGPDGKPAAGVRVEVEQKTHEFLFGCNLFVLGQLETAELNRRYEEGFLRLFNFATIPFYWEGTEPAKGELRYAEGGRFMWRRPPPDPLLKWCRERGVVPKGHPLLWHAFNPPWLPKDAEELRGLYLKRFEEIAARYAKDVPIWDVVNESLVCGKQYPLYSEDRAYVAWAFGEAHRLFGAGPLLMINEVSEVGHAPGEGNRYHQQVRSLLDAGVGVEGIGFQVHFFNRKALDGSLKSRTWSPANLLDVYERFAAFERPLYVTEITLSGAGEDGAGVQAEVTRNLYRLWFSAPRMAGITWWNLGDATAVKGELGAVGGLLDKDLNPKPAYRALEDLIHRAWKTRAEGTTDAEGRFGFRGSGGGYEVRAGGKKFEARVAAGRSGKTSLRLP
jgi:GH35 family endo-1,4-beta-xylanase